MADDEQFSLCWNNFNSNLSAGFHESLCRGDLVDVTLAAEGQFVKAHRLVLSVCSPYFRKMFTQMPANQHAFVFLKDVSHSALKDLIQFMYCGEVNVKQEALPAFISTAEALQIKGLTDGDPAPPQTPPEPTTPTPQVQQMAGSPRTRTTRNSTSHSYKVETLDDSASEEAKPHTTQMIIHTGATASNQGTTAIVHHTTQQQHHLQSTQNQQIVSAATPTATTTVLSHKRPAQRNLGSAPHIKRTKSTIETIDTSDHHQTAVQQQQITVQTAVVTTEKGHQPAETEYIDLPIELPTKSEPEYAEEAGDVESGEQDGTYVEDDSYGDIRYDESYFTENEDTGPNVTSATSVNSQSAPTTSKALVKQQPGSFSDSSYVETGNGQGDQTGSEAQETIVIATIPPNVQQKAKQGRPRKLNPAPKRTVAREKVKIAIKNNTGVPLVYASTIKGSMKLIYEGHHFIYFFRQGQYTIFQCCYRKCPVKIVSDQKLVYPLEGEHIHFMKATDKSATSIKIANVALIDTPMDTIASNVTIEDSQQKSNVDETTEQTLRSILTEDSNDQYQEAQLQTAEIGDVVTYLPLTNVEEQLAEMFEETSTSSLPFKVKEDLSENDNENDNSSSIGDPNDAKDFRDKIKQRLQAALLQRKKK